MKLKVKKLSPRAELPRYAHPGEDACFDLKVLIDDAENNPFYFDCGEKKPIPDSDRFLDSEDNTVGVWLGIGESAVFKTGLAFEIEPGHVMKVYARSSTGIKNHLALSNGTGLIDSGYRDQVRISLTNIGNQAILVRDGDRVAQAEICAVLPVEFEEATELSDSARGTGGIGSSGQQ